MSDMAKRVGYLKGLLESAELQKDSVNAKLLSGIVDLIGELSDRVDIVDDLLDDLNDYVESIDDDLSAMEDSDDGDSDDFQFFDADDDDEDFDDLDDGEDQLHLLRGDAEETCAPVLCPDCGRPFLIRYEDEDDASYACPHCGATVSPIEFNPETLPVAKPKE